MNQTWESGKKKKKKKKKFEPDFGSFSPNLSPKIFFRNFDHYQTLDIFQAITVINFNEN